MKKITLLTMSSLFVLGQATPLLAMLNEEELQTLKVTLGSMKPEVPIKKTNSSIIDTESDGSRVPKFKQRDPQQEIQAISSQKVSTPSLTQEEVKALIVEADKGSVGAMKKLETYYLTLQCPLSPNPYEACKWCEKAADLDDKDAKHAFVRILLNLDNKRSSRTLTFKEEGKVINYLNSLCKEGDPKALDMKGYMHFVGKILPKNGEEAFKYWGLAAERGYVRSSINISCKNLDDAAKTLNPVACSQKVRQSVTSLVQAFKMGSGRAVTALAHALIFYPDAPGVLSEIEGDLARDDLPLKFVEYLISLPEEKGYGQAAWIIKGQYFLMKNNEKEAIACFNKAKRDDYVLRLESSFPEIKKAKIDAIVRATSDVRYYSCTPLDYDLSDPGRSDPKVWNNFLEFLSQSTISSKQKETLPPQNFFDKLVATLKPGE